MGFFQGIFSFNNGLLNASQSKSLNYNYGLSKVSREIAINDQALSRKYIYPKEDIFNSNPVDEGSKIKSLLIPHQIAS